MMYNRDMATKIHPRAGEIVKLDNGHTGKVLSNGMVYDNDAKKFAGPVDKDGLTTAIKTQAQSNEMHALRREKAIEAAAKAIEDSVPVNMRKAGGDGWYAICRAMADKYHKSDNLRGMVEAARFLGQNAEYIQDKPQASQPVGDADFVRAVKELIETVRGDVVDGEVIG